MRAIRVLYLEDEPDVADSVGAALARAGRDYELCIATRIDAARALVQQRPFDLVIADYDLDQGRQHGSDFLLELVQSGYAVPLLLTSRQLHAQFDGPTRKLLRDGDCLYVSRPYLTSGQLEETLDYLLGRKLHVLCVDDDPEDVELINALLARAAPYHFDIHHAASADEARIRLDERQWDIVLIDWMLDPGSPQSGEQILEAMLPRSDDTNCVVLSGYPPEYLPEFAIRVIGRRAVSWCSKRKLTTAKLLQAIMAQRYRLSSTADPLQTP